MYVDDAFTLLSFKIDPFSLISIVNKFNPYIQFTTEVGKNGSLRFLNLFLKTVKLAPRSIHSKYELIIKN